MRVKDFMTSPAVAVRGDTPVKDAARLLVSNGFTVLPVVDGDGDLVGVVSEADLIDGRILPDPRALIGDVPPPPVKPAAQRVAGAMTADPVAVDPTADVAAVTRLMLDRKLRAVPVVEDGRLVGIVTRRDVLRTIARDDRDIARDVRLRLGIVCQQRWDVEVFDGVVTLVTEVTDPGERHVAQVVAAAQPGVLAVRIVDPKGAEAAPADR